MKTIRRLYLYAVAFISLMVVTWGLIGLARSAFAGDTVGDDVTQLAGALALIFVGIPVFLLHWWLAQRSASSEDDERYSYIRAVFLYGILLTTLIPVTQNLLAMINQIFFGLFDLGRDSAMFGAQTWVDNLVAIGMNTLIAGYIFSILRKDWSAASPGQAFAETRRLYRYIWMLYGLVMIVAGLMLTLLYIFDMLENKSIASQAVLVNGLSLIIIGIPIWVFSWRVIQKSIAQIEERGSLLRAIVLFAVNLISMVTALFAVGAFLDIFIQILLGTRLSFSSLMGDLRDPVSVAIPFGITWAYYSYIRRKDIIAVGTETPQLISVQHILKYLGAFFGVITVFVGTQNLLFFIIDLYVAQPVWTGVYRERLSLGIAMLVIGLPLWLLNWRKANRLAAQEGEEGDQARRSLTRKIYLYLLLFLGVMGVMISAGILLFHLLQAALGDPDDNLLQITLELLSILLLFFLVILYHGRILRSDGRLSGKFLAEQHAKYPILVLVSELGIFSEMLVTAFSKEAPTLPVAVQVVEQGAPDETLSDAKAVILPADIAANPGEAIRLWLQDFSGIRFVVPTPVHGWVWVSGMGNPLQSLVRQTVEMVRKLAEGEDLERARPSSLWLLFGYVFGGFIGLMIILIIISFLIEVIFP